jgi:hypothetical protein
MKSVTEFFVHKLAKGLETKTALAAEGKTPEEIEQSLGETFKLEGEKLVIFSRSLDVASKSLDKLLRIRVVTFDEGESVPADAVKMEEHYYLPNYKMTAPTPAASSDKKSGRDGRNRNRTKKNDGPKSSPWGESPEEIAAKKSALKKKSQEK